MKVEKLIEMNKANQSVTMQVKKTMHPTHDVLFTEVRVDKPEDVITIRSMDDNEDRREQSQIIVQENGHLVFAGNFKELADALTS